MGYAVQLIPCVLALIMGFILTYPVKIFGVKLGFIDIPTDDRRMHKDPIPTVGGLAIYGGIIGGAIAVICVSKFKKLKLTRVMDCVAPAVMLGQAVGRWGNFFNAEAYGVQLTEGDLLYFLRMGIIDANSTAPTTPYYHPAFFYEFLWNIIGFVLINVFYKKKKFDGQIVLSYLAWYGFGRMFIESIRVDSLMIGVIRVSQVVAFLCFAICSILLIVFYLKARRAELNEENYDMAFSRVTGIYAPTKSETAPAEVQKSEKNDSVSEAENNTPSDETNEADETSDTPIGFSDDIAERLKNLFDTDNDK